jgi:plasmid stabilization system protein ParE
MTRRRPAGLSIPAKRWLNKEVTRIAAYNEKAARQLIARFRSVKESLGAFPKLGMQDVGIRHDMRKLILTPYILKIAEVSERVEIVSIYDGRYGPCPGQVKPLNDELTDDTDENDEIDGPAGP